MHLETPCGAKDQILEDRQGEMLGTPRARYAGIPSLPLNMTRSRWNLQPASADTDDHNTNLESKPTCYRELPGWWRLWPS